MMIEVEERKEKPYLKVFTSVIGSVVLIDFTIFIANKYTGKYPYLTNIIVLFLLIFTCSLIIIKFFSKYSYTLEDDQLNFHRLIGKRAFPMLQLDLKDISNIRPYRDDSDLSFKYKFVFGNNYTDCYVGEYVANGNEYYFLFKPSAKMYNVLSKKIK